MDDIFGFIIFVVIFVLGPILEHARRKQQKPPGRPLPHQQLPQQRPREESQTPVGAGSSRTEEMSATTVLPDDLWEVLTGQPRPQQTPVPRPQHTPVPAPDIEDEEFVDEEALIVEDVQVETRRSQREEGFSLERTTRHEVPVVVSMETLPPAPAVRHAAFHKKIDAPPTPTPALATSHMPRLKGRKALRQAMLMQAVLGKPKALE